MYMFCLFHAISLSGGSQAPGPGGLITAPGSLISAVCKGSDMLQR